MVTIPGGLSENAFIDHLFRLDSRYGDNLDYDLYPSNPDRAIWWLNDDGYNSNSYIRGLLNAAGVKDNYPIPNETLPGWFKPVPTNEF